MNKNISNIPTACSERRTKLKHGGLVICSPPSPPGACVYVSPLTTPINLHYKSTTTPFLHFRFHSQMESDATQQLQ